MIKKIVSFLISFTLIVGCNKEESRVKYYKFADTKDCAECTSMYCFYYDSAFHYSANWFGFYQSPNGFLRDSMYFKSSLPDSIGPVSIPRSQNILPVDSIRCSFIYESGWKFNYEMMMTKYGECKLLIFNPNEKKGVYVFNITPSEFDLVSYAVNQLSVNDTGMYKTYNNKEPWMISDIWFAIQICNGNNTLFYGGNHNADYVPDEVYFFSNAMGAIAQNHFSKQTPSMEITKPFDWLGKMLSFEITPLSEILFKKD